MPKVSVIVPIYKAEKYIKRCVDSLFSQTLDSVEYIFIDDASPDNSIAILKRELESYPDRCSYVRIIRNFFNMGVAASRRRGIELATGEYIIHCDSDDWVDDSMYQYMYEEAVEGNYSIVVCDFLEENANYLNVRKGRRSNTSDMVSDCVLLHGSLCNKMVSRFIAQSEKIRWPVANCGEDLALSFQYSLMAESVGYIEKPFYHYIRSDSSILGINTEDAILRRHEEMQANYHILRSTLIDYGLYHFYRREMVHEGLFIKNMLLSLLKKGNDNLQRWRKSCEEVNPLILTCAIVTVREKLNYIVTYVGLYPLYCRLFK